MDRSTDSEKIVAFLLYPGVTMLDLVGPLQVISKMQPPFRAVVVAEDLGPMKADASLTLSAEMTFEQVPEPFALVVPGGMGATKAMANERLLDYIKGRSGSVNAMAAVCTGSLILAAAGLLQGRKASTHWSYAKVLNAMGAEYQEQRWVRDGKFFTSAGVSAGIDMAFALVAEWGGMAQSKSIQLGLEYDPRPPFGPIDWNGVDRDSRLPKILVRLREDLADKPALLERIESGLRPG
ncbi:MAG: Intracellular protease 1 [Methanomassiliicoccales archaeon PtaU1.Bin124]|nr:MAG: Intracellular protease 1 [Methanomassiliicoccales archaeon PtaU1.Bin124]